MNLLIRHFRDLIDKDPKIKRQLVHVFGKTLIPASYAKHDTLRAYKKVRQGSFDALSNYVQIARLLTAKLPKVNSDDHIFMAIERKTDVESPLKLL